MSENYLSFLRARRVDAIKAVGWMNGWVIEVMPLCLDSELYLRVAEPGGGESVAPHIPAPLAHDALALGDK